MSFTTDELLRALDVGFNEDYDEAEYQEMLNDEYYTPGSIVSWSELAYEAEYGRAKVTIDGVEYPVTKKAETGGMDEGSYASYVFEIGGRFFRKTGYYQSHYGYDWDGDFSEVEEYERTVTDYRPL